MVKLFTRPLWPGIYLLPAVMLILLLAWPLATLPGEGLNVTLNLLTWLGCALWGLSLIPALLRQRWQGKNTLYLLAVGAVLMTIPWLWTPHEFQQTALYRLTGLWVLVLLVAVLRQVSLHGAAHRRLYAIIAVAGILQTLLAGWQLIWPDSASLLTGFDLSRTGGRPTGSLLQANLLGSFLATALLCSIWLVFSPAKWQHRGLPIAAVFILAAGVFFSLSRTALFAALPAAGILLYLTPGRRLIRLMVAGVILAGMMTGQGILDLRPSALPVPAGDERPVSTDARLEHDRQHSGTERQALIHGAVMMIAQAPWSGNGLATFEHRFPEALASADAENPFTVTVSHPHNELLYVWSEGGILATFGLLLWLGLWGSLFLRHRRIIARRALLTLPLIAHCMTEMPLYLSSVHFVLLALLLRLSLPADRPVTPHPLIRQLSVAGVLFSCFAGVVFMGTGLQSVEQLQSAERFRLMDPQPLMHISNPLAQPDRLQFDRSVNLLMMYNLEQEPSLIEQFIIQATDWQTRHNDANLTATLMQLARYRGDAAQEQYWQQRGCLSFRLDGRFQCQNRASFSGGKSWKNQTYPSE